MEVGSVLDVYLTRKQEAFVCVVISVFESAVSDIHANVEWDIHANVEWDDGDNNNATITLASSESAVAMWSVSPSADLPLLLRLKGVGAMNSLMKGPRAMHVVGPKEGEKPGQLQPLDSIPHTHHHHPPRPSPPPSPK